MAQATLRHGNPAFINYTAAADITAGDVVMLGNTTGLTCGIAHQDIENTFLGALAVGGGVYEVVNLNNAANYATVYWDYSVDKVTTVSTNNSLFGYIVEDGAGGANTNCLVLHWPRVA